MTHETEMKVTSQRHLLVIFATFKSFVARIESVSKEFRQGFQRAFECYVQTLKINKKKGAESAPESESLSVQRQKCKSIKPVSFKASLLYVSSTIPIRDRYSINTALGFSSHSHNRHIKAPPASSVAHIPSNRKGRRREIPWNRTF